ncbi:MAG: hypothetical protein M1831_006282 [Alyxoria varia]|nr:MAG: hypothetical protein M1831_006282 [Alyxoria varia]
MDGICLHERSDRAVHRPSADAHWSGFLYCPQQFEQALLYGTAPSCDLQVCRYPKVLNDYYKRECTAQKGAYASREPKDEKIRAIIKKDLRTCADAIKPTERAMAWQSLAIAAKQNGWNNEVEICVDEMRRIFRSGAWKREIRTVWDGNRYAYDLSFALNDPQYSAEVRWKIKKRAQECPYL